MNKKWIVSMLMAGMIVLASGCSPTAPPDPTATEPPPPTDTATPTPTNTPTPTPTATPTPTNTPTPTPLPPIAEPPAPSPEKANVYGRVLWQGQPVEGLMLNIWPSSASVVTTDPDGYFLFQNIYPGTDRELVLMLDKSEVTVGEMGEVEFGPGKIGLPKTLISYPADESTNLGYIHLVPTDLTLLTPAREADLDHAYPLLSWEPYPEAASYHVVLEQRFGNYTNIEFDTVEPQVQIELPLMKCLYGWDVTAYDANGIPLATTDAYYVDTHYEFTQEFDGLFTVDNPSLPSCNLILLSPRANEVIPRSQGVIEFIWEAHPLAVKYGFTLRRTYNAAGDFKLEIVVADSFEVAPDGSYQFPYIPPLTPGRYIWHMTAYAEDGRVLASSYGYGILHYHSFTIQ